MSEFNMNEHLKAKYLARKGGGHGVVKARTGNSHGAAKPHFKDPKSAARNKDRPIPTLIVNGATGHGVFRYITPETGK